MKKGFISLVVILCMAILTQPRLQLKMLDLAESDQYGKKAAGMVGGPYQRSTSPVDLVVQTVEAPGRSLSLERSPARKRPWLHSSSFFRYYGRCYLGSGFNGFKVSSLLKLLGI
jgi:hypothetical protein